MEQPEVPLENVQEHLEHEAHHSGSGFVSLVAVSTAILAAFAAVASLLAGHLADEAMLEQIQSSDQWAFYQAKSIKASILETKIALLSAQGQPANAKDTDKLATYDKEKKEIEHNATHLHEESQDHLKRHTRLARGVTLLQIAIAIGAISALTKRKPFWFMSMAAGVAGIYFLIGELLHSH